MKKMWILMLCCFVAFAALPALADEGAPAKPPENANGMPLMPDFTLPSADGKEVSLFDYEGRQVVLYFWATWCPYCVAGMPAKQALYDWMQENEFPGEVWAINLADGVRETRKTCDEYIERNGFTMPVLYEETGALANGLGITGIPVTIVVDAEGYLKGGASGPQSLEDTIALLEKDL
jgi:peroxiredoxin